jgi:hypothetical protein
MAELTDAQVQIAGAMLERELSQNIFDAARALGWLVSRYPTWRKTETTPGYPDLTMIRGGRLIFVELKRERGTTSPVQEQWLLGISGVGQAATHPRRRGNPRPVEWRIWRPRNWLSGEILEVLA